MHKPFFTYLVLTSVTAAIVYLVIVIANKIIESQ